MIKFSFFLSLFTLLVVSGCTETTSPQLPIKIALIPFPGYTYAFVAKEKKLFTKWGVQVELVVFPDQPNASQAYEEGKTEGLFVPFTDAIVFSSKGIETVVVYCTDYSETADLIVGRPEINNLSELKGKTISFEGFNTFSHLFVVTMLEHVGIHEGQFKALNLESSRVILALKSHEIDAGHIYEPESSRAIAEGFKVLATAGDIPNIITDTLIFHADLIKNRPQEVQGIVDALVEARNLIETHPVNAFTIMARVANVSVSEMEASFKRLHALNLEENIEAFKVDGTLFTLGKRIIDFYEQKGQLRRKPLLSEIINGQFVIATGEKVH